MNEEAFFRARNGLSEQNAGYELSYREFSWIFGREA
jgi:hypothetical protein